MAVYIDDQPFDAPQGNLAAVLAAAQKSMEAGGRMVVEVKWNGQSIVGAELQQRSTQPIDGVEVHLVTADPRRLAVSALRQAQAMLDESRRQIAAAAEALQRDQSDQGVRLMGQAVDVWHQLPQAIVQSAELLHLDITPLIPQGRSVKELAEQVGGGLKDIRNALQAKDTTALADLLAYEWPGICDTWDRLLVNLIERIENGPK